MNSFAQEKKTKTLVVVRFFFSRANDMSRKDIDTSKYNRKIFPFFLDAK
jgi:hypothetical protein